MRRSMVVLAMGRGSGSVSVGRAIMQLCGTTVRTWWHGLLLNLRTLVGRRPCCSSYVIQEHGALSNLARDCEAGISELEYCQSQVRKRPAISKLSACGNFPCPTELGQKLSNPVSR